jgi:hypothetical protein
MRGSGSREALEHRENQTATSADSDHGSSRGWSGWVMDKESEAGNGYSRKICSIGSVSVGGKQFNLPKQAVVLL